MITSIVVGLLIASVNLGLSYLLNRSGKSGRERIEQDLAKIVATLEEQGRRQTDFLERLARMAQRQDDHDRRIDKLERKLWGAP